MHEESGNFQSFEDRFNERKLFQELKRMRMIVSIVIIEILEIKIFIRAGAFLK